MITLPRSVDETLAIDPERPGAYQWWYFDATSDDGEHTLVVIFFVGSVFSPWYAARLSAGESAKPREHAAVNVALYRRGTRGPVRWAFTEYADPRALEGSLDRSLRIGRSRLSKRDDGEYEISFDERSPVFSLPLPLQGRARFTPVGASGVEASPFALDRAGVHRWLPVAPRCRVEVTLTAPSLRFSGDGYHDVNHGDATLGSAFSRWTWARAHGPVQTRIRYDRVERDGARRVLSVSAASHGSNASDLEIASPMDLSLGRWALRAPRTLRVDANESLGAVECVESSPFYARYTGRTVGGDRAVAEHLDLERFAMPAMWKLLPFRARRER